MKIRIFLAIGFLLFMCSAYGTDTSLKKEVIELVEGIKAYKKVQVTMEENQISIDEVVEAFNTAFRKGKHQKARVFYEETRRFILHIRSTDRMIVSIMMRPDKEL